MTDRHTQQAMELLAELYLTPAATGAADPDIAPPAATGSPPASPIHDPSPIPIQSYRTGPLERADEARPSMHLTAVETRPVAMTAALMGHLPGYASPWVSQFAHHAALRHGGSLLIRLSPESAELELFQPEVAEASSRVVDPAAGIPEDSLPRALERAMERVGSVILLMSDPAEGLEGLVPTDLPSWTLLSGCDEAAVVGAYRLLKGLMTRFEGRAPVGGISVMWMGAEQPAAEGALERLRRAVGSHLHLNLRMEGFRPRMEPVRRRSLGRFSITDDPGQWSRAVAMLLEAAAPAGVMDENDDEQSLVELSEAELEALRGDDAVVEVTGPEAEPEPDPLPLAPEPRITASIDRVAPLPRADVEHAGAAVGSWAGPSVAPVAAAGPTEIRARPAVDRAEPSSSAPAAAVGSMSREPEVHAADAGTPSAGPHQLAGYVEGAAATVARCPRHPEIQLAIASDGRLLLLAHAAGDAVLPSVRDLMEVKAWAQEHRTLLALACHDRPLRIEVAPAIHLFTDKPRDAMRLAATGSPDDPALTLHLLKPVTISGRTIHVHERLN